MGISDEIEVATIELPIHSRLTTLVVQRRQRNLPKSVLHVQSFRFAYLRTVPTNGKYFFPDNDYVRQVDHIRGY